MKMTKMKWQLCALVIVILLILCATKGSLVQAQGSSQGENQDAFVGFHIVVGAREQDRSAWVEYGTQDEIDLGKYGSFSFPREVLFGSFQPDTGEWLFEGMPGYNAFYTTRPGEPDVSSGYAGLHADVKIGFHSNIPYSTPVITDPPTAVDDMAQTSVKERDATQDDDALEGASESEASPAVANNETASISLSGTVYLPATKEDVFVTYYRVYKTPDGRIYLDGSGNTTNSVGETGRDFGMGSTEEETVTVNGNQEYTKTTEIWVDIEFVHPCAALTLLEYNAQNECIATNSLDATAQEQDVSLQADTTWCVVQETDEAGVQHHTALNVSDAGDDGQLYHGFVVKTPESLLRSAGISLWA